MKIGHFHRHLGNSILKVVMRPLTEAPYFCKKSASTAARAPGVHVRDVTIDFGVLRQN